MFDGINKIFVIHGRPTRRADIEAELHGHDYTLIIEPSLSISDAHRVALESIASGPEGLSLIVEDDVILRDDAAEQWARLLPSVPALDADIVFWGCDTSKKGVRGGDCHGFDRVRWALHTHAYVVSKESARRVLDAIGDSPVPIDYLIAKSELRMFVTRPVLALQSHQTYATDERPEFRRHCKRLQRMDGYTTDALPPVSGPVLIQNGTGNHAEMLRLTQAAHAHLCAAQGFEYRPTYLRFPNLPHDNWSKIPLIRQTLAGTPEDQVIIYADCDVLFRPHARLREILPAPFELGFARKCGEQSTQYRDAGVYNVGVAAMRNTPRVRTFWAEVEALGPIPGIEWHDQETINEVLDEVKGALNFLELDRTWNDYRKPQGRESMVWAWHGLGDEAVRARMREAVQ